MPESPPPQFDARRGPSPRPPCRRGPIPDFCGTTPPGRTAAAGRPARTRRAGPWRRGGSRGAGLDRLVHRPAPRRALREWRADGRIGLAILVVVALGAGVVFYRVGVGSGDAAAAPADAPASSTRSSSRSSTRSSSSRDRATPTDRRVARILGVHRVRGDRNHGLRRHRGHHHRGSATGSGRKGARVVVHVAGAVTTPGVVELARGDAGHRRDRGRGRRAARTPTSTG